MYAGKTGFFQLENQSKFAHYCLTARKKKGKNQKKINDNYRSNEKNDIKQKPPSQI